MTKNCYIKFNNNPGNTHISQIMAGYKLLDKSGIIKIKSAEPYDKFRSDGNYEHNSIAEVCIDGKIIAYDMADGYQSIHRKDVFDSQLDRVDFYFKRSYYPDFHKEMKNRDKIKPLGLNYLCTCKNNPYDAFYKNGNSFSEFNRFIHYISSKRIKKFYYSDFESNGIKYDSYKILFLTRLWDSSQIKAENIIKTYPYFSFDEAKAEAEKWKETLDFATKSRIRYIKIIKEHFGDKAVAGVQASELARKLCPELIVGEELSERRHFLQMIKKNYICVASEGLHHSIGWKFGEYAAAGKAVVTEPLFYEVPYGFAENKNYLVYHDEDTLIKNCDNLMSNTDLVHTMENNNTRYYQEHLSPDKLVLDTLNTAGIFS